MPRRKVAKTDAAEKASAGKEKVPAGKAMLDSIISPREQLILLHSLLTVAEFPGTLVSEVDVIKVAERLQLQNPRSVNNAWGTIKKKLSVFRDEQAKATGGGAITPDEDETEDEEPPKKRTRTTRASTAAAKVRATRKRGKQGASAAARPAPKSESVARSDTEEEVETKEADTVQTMGNANEKPNDSNEASDEKAKGDEKADEAAEVEKAEEDVAGGN